MTQEEMHTHPTSGAPAKALPVAEESDQQIEASFRESYVHTAYLKDDAIKATAVDGIVTLTGTVADESHKTLAGETVANLLGVTYVNNRLSTRADIEAETADTWMGRRLKLALLFHRNVSGLATAITVKDGNVILTGKASSIAQKELTTEYASDIEGVKTVDNQMTVAAEPKQPVRTAGEKLDDASVTAQVKTALMTHRSTNSIKTKAATLDGMVTLTGIAKNAAEIALVTKLVRDIQGVAGVRNQMTVLQAAAE